MNGEPQPPKRAPKRLSVGGCLLIGLGVMALLMLVSCLGIVGWRSAAARRAENMLAEISERGEPVSAAELDAYYALPDGAVDTTELWVAAMAPLDGAAFSADAGDLPVVGTSNAEIPPPGQPWAELEDVEALLAKYAETMERLHRAAEQGSAARYDLNFEDGFAMLLEHVQTLRGAARMLSLEAHVRAHRGDAHGAAESVHAINMLGKSLEREPVMVSQLVRIAVGGVSTDLFRRLLPHVEFSDADLQRLSKDYRTARYNEGFRRSLLGERTIGIQAFLNPAGDEALGGELGPAAGHMLHLNRHEDLCQYLALMEKMLAAAQKPTPQARKELAQVKQDLAAVTSSPLNRVRYPLSTLLLPALDAALEAAARANGLNDSAMTAIAIERYRRDRGRIPDDLQQLVPDFLPAVPTDPYDGKPIRYVVKEDEYLIYCIGRDDVDDGGQGEYDPDVVFKVKRR
ncbi:MAG: hypothetical protein H8E44_17055 [Planctomycetes bacterium]|nr:hypothetical protein [Planctomycetota bacterium]MBL7038128.1 hypothetical protein [Pirellulaceae bacterium]